MVECPACNSVVRYFSDDAIANYICSGCGFMATTKFMENLTDGQRQQIKKDRDDIRRHYADQSARYETDRIARRRSEIEQKDRLAGLLQTHKKLIPLDSFNVPKARELTKG